MRLPRAGYPNASRALGPWRARAHAGRAETRTNAACALRWQTPLQTACLHFATARPGIRPRLQRHGSEIAPPERRQLARSNQTATMIESACSSECLFLTILAQDAAGQTLSDEVNSPSARGRRPTNVTS